MKIALIHPKIFYDCECVELYRYSNQWYRDIFSRAFNLNLLRLATLTPEEHEVILIDENRKEIDLDADFDLVGVTAMTYQVDRAYEIAKEFKKRGVQTILGGVHASVLPEEALMYFDAVCCGEVESVWQNILRDAKSRKLQSRYLGERIQACHFPKPDYFRVKELLGPNQIEEFCFFPIMSSRGCPRGCDYCSATYLFKKSYRKKTIGRVIEEIRSIKCAASNLGIQKYHIEFGDDNFTIDIRRTKELLKALIDENIQYTVSADIAAADDPELLELLQVSGCKIISVGVESIEDEILGELGQWKLSQIKKTEKNIEAFFQHGIIPACNFMVGSDHTTLGTFRGIRQFVERLPVLFNLLMFTPFPGTPYLSYLRKQGRMRPQFSWKHFNLFNMVFEPKQMSVEAFYEAFEGLRLDLDHRIQYERSLNYSTVATQFRAKRRQSNSLGFIQ